MYTENWEAYEGMNEEEKHNREWANQTGTKSQVDYYMH